MVSGESLLAQFSAFLFQCRFLFSAGCIESARANELNNATEFIAVKPAAVAFADIYNHTRAASKVDAVHQLRTFGARRITNLTAFADFTARSG